MYRILPDYVPSDLWSGLPLTLILSLLSMILGFPLAVLLALGRRRTCLIIDGGDRGHARRAADHRAVHGQVMLPLFLPPGFTIDKLLRALVAIIAVPRRLSGRGRARRACRRCPRASSKRPTRWALSYWQKTKSIILPQALRW
jgi:general L-amino acid transport system permease protein